jgi:hypothetical protein
MVYENVLEQKKDIIIKLTDFVENKRDNVACLKKAVKYKI